MSPTKPYKDFIGTLHRFFNRGRDFLNAVPAFIDTIANRIEPKPLHVVINDHSDELNSRHRATLFYSHYKELLQSIENRGRRVADLNNNINETYQTAKASIDQEARKKVADIEHRYQEKRHAAKKDFQKEITLLKKKRRNLVAQVESAFQKELNETEKNHQGEIKRIKSNLSKKRAVLARKLKKTERTHPTEWKSWDDDYWDHHYTPPEEMPSSALTRVGEYRMEVDGARNPLLVPAFLPIISVQNVIIKACESLRNRALQMMRILMLRLLVGIPPGKLKIEMLDPLGLGSNMAGFMHLPEVIVGSKIWTEPEQIERRLMAITEDQEKVYQTYLRNDFSSIGDYNRHAGKIAEPYRVIIILDFPANFTETAAQRLLTIATNGPRTGVYLLLLRDMSRRFPPNFDLASMENISIVISAEGDRINWHDADLKDFELSIDKLPPWEKTKRLLKTVGEKAISASKIEVPYSTVINQLSKCWESGSSEGLSIPIGRSSANGIVYLELGKGSDISVLIGAMTGAGKSNLLHVIITGFCIHYAPEEVNLYLVDFKKGVEFKEYAGVEFPHVKVIAIESDREYGLSVVQKLILEMNRRGDLFRNEGVQNIGQFRSKYPERIMPRIVMVIDEFQDFFAEDDRLSQGTVSSIDRLARKGRSFGIHLVLASQSMAGVQTLPRSTFDQMGIRIALQCSDMESRLILGEDNPQAKLLSRPGEACLNNKNGLIEGNVLFQVFHLPDRQRKQNLKELGRLEKSWKRKSSNPTKVIFEGNAPANIRNNEKLKAILKIPVSSHDPKTGLIAWLGEPIAIKPPTGVNFHRESRSNLLIIGKNEKVSTAMKANAVISLAAQKSTKGIEFLLFDFTRPDSNGHHAIRSLRNYFPHKMALYDRGTVNNGIDKAFECVNMREKTMSDKTDTAVFLILMGIHRASKLRSEDGYTFPETTERLIHILDHGPETAVFTICWGDTLRNTERIIGRNLHEFGFRVALQMPVGESNEFIDCSDAAKLGKFRAILYDEDRAEQLEKFRPYAMPDEEWLKQTGGVL